MKNCALRKGIVLLMCISLILNLFGCGRNVNQNNSGGENYGQTGDGERKMLTVLELRESGYNPGFHIRISDGKLEYENLDEGIRDLRGICPLNVIVTKLRPRDFNLPFSYCRKLCFCDSIRDLQGTYLNYPKSPETPK